MLKYIFVVLLALFSTSANSQKVENFDEVFKLGDILQLNDFQIAITGYNIENYDEDTVAIFLRYTYQNTSDSNIHYKYRPNIFLSNKNRTEHFLENDIFTHYFRESINSNEDKELIVPFVKYNTGVVFLISSEEYENLPLLRITLLDEISETVRYIVHLEKFK